jgi:predicted dehydrogenase
MNHAHVPAGARNAPFIRHKPNPTMNRRTFLQTSLSCAALAVAPSSFAAAAAGASPAKPRIPLGFLGATYSHGPEKIKLALSSPDWEFVGVCETSEAGRRTCAKLGAKLISQEELFQRARVVAVESDVRDHAPHAMLALQAGKHVHLEKPPALKLADMQAVVALAREKNLLLQTGFMWRYHPGFTAIFDAVRQGWLGEVFLVRGYISNHLAPARRAEWGEYRGGAMFELGSHLIDATVRLLGKPKAVTPFLRRHGQFEDALKDNNVAVLEYDRATAVIVNTALQPGGAPPRSFEVLGANGTAALQPIEPPALTLDLAQPAGPYKKGEQKIPLPDYQRYEADLAELAAAVRGERALSVSLDEELLVAETVLRAGDMVIQGK